MHILHVLIAWLKKLFGRPKTYSLAIVRRYTDANGSFVGELYLLGSFAGILGYQMIGMSLDTLPFDIKQIGSFDLDTDNDFLKPMPSGCVRVGAQEPRDTPAVRSSVARLAREGTIVLQVQNRFVEHVLSRKDTGKGDVR